jgi:ribose 1,5-bisphosphokinase
MSAALIYVMGPSGVGKDSLLNWLRAHVRSLPTPPALHFARRTVTRSLDNSNEDHEAVGFDAFAQLQQAGAFALHWQAHGLHYGVRHEEITGRRGWVMVNGSRAYAARARVLFPGMTALHVSAPEAVVRARLAARQRETAAEVEARIQRSQSAGVAAAPGDLHIVNADALEATARMLCELLQTRTGLRLIDPI